MKLLVFILLVIATLRKTGAELVDRKCMAPGLMCKDCTTIKLCTRNGTNYQEEVIGECTGEAANCHNGRCVKQKNPLCDRTFDNFFCTSSGFFPDAYDCQKYHYCVDGELISTTWCHDALAYNSRTQKCDIKLPQNKCDFPTPPCSEIGQHGTLSSDTSFYYICKMHNNSLYPFIYKCPNNQVYDGNYGCY